MASKYGPFTWGEAIERRNKRQDYTGVSRTLQMIDKSVGRGWILQEVRTTVSGSKFTDDVRHFTEGWRVSGRGVFTPDKGRDYFVVPWDYCDEESGILRIKATSWFVPFRIGRSYRHMGLSRYAENVNCHALYCRDGKVKREFHSYHKFVRRAKLCWSKVDTSDSWTPNYKERDNKWVHRDYDKSSPYFVV